MAIESLGCREISRPTAGGHRKSGIVLQHRQQC